LPIKK